MTTIELFATQNCWQCSFCKQKYDAMGRPTKNPFVPPKISVWYSDKPTFNFCPMCGEKIEKEKEYTIEDIEEFEDSWEIKTENT